MKTLFHKLMVAVALSGIILLGGASPTHHETGEAPYHAATASLNEPLIKLSDVTTYADGKLYLQQSCPTVKMKTVDGDQSVYDPNIQAIEITLDHLDEKMFRWVFIHELMHHYQWHGKYKVDGDSWNRGLEGDQPIEVQADQMTYYVHGDPWYGNYTSQPATGEALEEIKYLIKQGEMHGC